MTSSERSLIGRGDRKLKGGLLLIGGLMIADVIIAFVSYAGN